MNSSSISGVLPGFIDGPYLPATEAGVTAPLSLQIAPSATVASMSETARHALDAAEQRNAEDRPSGTARQPRVSQTG